MHIALVYNRFRTDGGTERMALNTFRAMAGRGLRFTVVARQWRGDDAENVAYRRCAPPALGRGGKLRTFARTACRELAGLDADLVQSQVHLDCCDVYRADGGAHAEWLAQRRRVLGPWRRRYQARDRYHRLKLDLERRMYLSPRLQAVICNSAMVRDDILRHYPAAANKLHVIENAVDTAHYRPPEDCGGHRHWLRETLGIDPAAPVFTFVGSGFERKGVATAIKALAAIPGAHLALVGRESRLRRYRALAHRAGVSAQVHFLGPQPDVRPYLWAADALVHPALYEPFGLAVLEAMAAGLPVIASNKTGAALALVHSAEMGYVQDALDVDGYSRAMRATLARDQRERAQARTACLEAAAEYDLARMRGQLTRFYESMLGVSRQE